MKHIWSHYCERFTNNPNLSFRDEEVATIYMFGIIQGYRTKKQIHSHANDYWKVLFPKLPRYEAFIHRINQLSDMFIALIKK